MDSTHSYGLIRLGLCIRFLCHIEQSSNAKLALTHLTMLKNGLSENHFDVSIAGWELLQDYEKYLKSIDPESSIPPETINGLHMMMLTFEKIVYAEAKTKLIYLLPKRRFNSDYLLDNQTHFFKDGLFQKLPKLAQTDIRSSCRCILFGEATAAAFHILRATEDVLKCYYHHHIKQNRLEKPMWGPMTNALKLKRRNKPPKVLLDSLDLVRNSYRNPTQHPEATYDIESCQDLLGVCIDLISKMASELP